MKKIYSHDNWNQVLQLPDNDPQKKEDLHIIGRLATGNLQWFVRRCIALDIDVQQLPREKFIEPTVYTEWRRKFFNEDTKS